KIVTLGTPFMDTMSPVLQRITRKSSFLTGLSWIALIWLILSLPIGWTLTRDFAFPNLSTTGVVLSTVGIFLTAALVFALLVFGPKSQTAKPISNRAAQMQPKFLAIGSLMDEPWQLLHHMRNARNPMAVQTNLTRYLISSMRSDISRSSQVARIY